MSPQLNLGSLSNKNNKEANRTGFDTILVARLVLASIIFAVAIIVKLPEIVKFVLLTASAIAAGYDIVLEALDTIEARDYFAAPVLVTFVTVLAFVIGFGAEGAAVCILYHVGKLLIEYSIEQTKHSAVDLVKYQTKDTVGKVKAIIGADGAGETQLALDFGYAASFVLKGAIIIAVLYAIITPLVSDLSFTVAAHRALTIIVIATPGSVITAIPFTHIVGICYSAVYGLIFRNANAVEKANEIDTVIFDKNGVITDAHPHVLSVLSDVIDTNTFMNFAAHAMYNSEQPVAKAVADAFDGEYHTELISDFTDIPGYGVELTIANANVIFATSELFAGRGVDIPADDISEGLAYYMTISGKYVGRILLSDEAYDFAEELIADTSNCGISKCILLTSDGEEESVELAGNLGIKEVHAQCDEQMRLDVISDVSKNASVMYVYSEGLEAHSDALVDVRVGEKGKHADIIVSPSHIINLPAGLAISRRTHEIAVENAVFAFAVKAILIFLAMIGFCNIWFAIFVDTAATLATILNSIRVTKESLLAKIKEKI